jgi:uncharacterized membrane-anchored protein
MKKFILPIFILLVLVQWLVPGEIIWKKERILLTGKEFKFETEPVDPSNPFMGRYIRLNFKADEFRYDNSLDLRYGQEVFVELKKNPSGFAEIKNVSIKQPPADRDYVKAEVSSIANGEKSQDLVYIRYPFLEYYMDEFKAQRAEELYRSANRDSIRKSFAIVKVLNGYAVIKDVIINDRPINDWFR